MHDSASGSTRSISRPESFGREAWSPPPDPCRIGERPSSVSVRLSPDRAGAWRRCRGYRTGSQPGLSVLEDPFRVFSSSTACRASAGCRVGLPPGLSAQTDPTKRCAAVVADPLPGLLRARGRGTARRSIAGQLLNYLRFKLKSKTRKALAAHLRVA